MELKSGYKQTEVGVIPEDWEVVKLSELCLSIKDGTHLTPNYANQGIPFYSVENVTANDFEDTKFITQQEHSQLTQRCKPEKGDILLTRIGTLGHTKLLDWDVNASIYVSLALLRLNDRADPEYIYRYSKSQSFVRNVEKRSLLNATPIKINMRDIGGIPIPVPRSLTEQRAIAAALSDVDALINALDQLIAKKRDIKQATMQQLLTGKLRLPGFRLKSGHKQTEVGVIPEDWDVRTVGKIAEVKTGPFGSALHEKDYVNDGTPIITVEHLGERGVVHKDLPMVSEIDKVRLSAYSLRPGDIVFSRVGSVDRNALIKEAENGWLFSGSILRVRPTRGRVYPAYLSYHFHSEPLKQRVKNVAVGQTRASLNTQILKDVIAILPPTIHEQQAIATVLSDMDAEITALEQKRDKSRVLKQGMMQELLTGRTRLI